MTGEVTPLLVRSDFGSYLGAVHFFRRVDGSIHANLVDMPAHVIDGKATLCDRFFMVAHWCLEGVTDLMRQGLRFDEDTRASIVPEEQKP